MDITFENVLGLYNGNLEWVKNNTVLFGYAGSHSYGLNTPTSDFDFKGICFPPKEYLYGFLNNFEQLEVKKDENNIEFSIYELRKFFKLGSNANPNILETIFLEPSDYLFLNNIGEKLLENRSKFLSQKVVHTYTGYSVAQLKKIKSHRAWLMCPLTKEPIRSDFGLPQDRALISKDNMGAYEDLVNKEIIKEENVSENFLEILAKEKAYFQAHRQYQQYREWKKNRNPERAKLEEKFGLDCKHACHLVRLMLQAKEILTKGVLTVKRTEDREFLMGIRNGAWTYDQLIEFAEKEEKELFALVKTSKLPKEPDRVFLDNLCIELIEMSL